MKYLSCVILIFTFSVLFFSCKSDTEQMKDKPPAIVDVMIAEKIDFPTNLEVNGSVLSEEMVELRPEISGRLTYLNIPDGASVNRGTVLAKINDTELQAQLEQQKVQLDIAVKTEQRLKKLLDINGVNQAEYDAAVSQVNSINANINVINAQIDKTIIMAPFDGKLGLRIVSPGAYVTPQTIIGTLQQTDKIKIDFTVPESYSDLAIVGNNVFVQTNDSDEKLIAVISAIEPQINPDTRNIKVRARLKSGNINPGAFVKVLFDKNEKVIVVPSNAIIPDASSNKIVLIKNKKTAFTNVETGIRNEDMIEIISGVNPGDTVVVSGVLFVRPKEFVKIRSVKTQFVELSSDSNQVVK